MTCLSFGKKRHCTHFCSTCLNGPFIECRFAIICHRSRCKWFTKPIKARLDRNHTSSALGMQRYNARRCGLIRGLSVEDIRFVREVAHDLVRAERGREWMAAGREDIV